MNKSKLILFALALFLSARAFALSGYDQHNKCTVEVKGPYKNVGDLFKLKMGDTITIVDGCDKTTRKVEFRYGNRFETNDGILYRLDILDKSRIDDLRTRSIRMDESTNSKETP